MEAESNPGASGHSHLSDPGKEARAKSGVPVVPVFDGFRAFAILGVVMLHMFGASGVVAFGDDGLLARLVWGTNGRVVEVLFVISGFVVFLPTVARSGDFGSLASYAIRRAARLLPAYWLVIAICLVLIGLVDLNPDVPLPGFVSVAGHVSGLEVPISLFTSNYPVGFGVNPPLWTLSLEVAFYIVLPIIAAVYFRHPWIGLGIAAVVTAVWDTFFHHVVDIASAVDIVVSASEALRLLTASGAQLPAWAFSFALGMTGAWAYVAITRSPDSAERRKRVAALLGVSATALMVLAFVLGGYFSDVPGPLPLSMAFSLALATTMLLIALAPNQIQWPFANERIRALGDISYGIYLIHLVLVIFLGQKLSLPRDGTFGDLLIWMAVVMPLSILYGYLSARFLEQPIRRWARKFGRRAAPLPAPETVPSDKPSST
ncbi:MAG: acyltransferase [Solirubrobacterales bacterium]|nr:acyltransferase [Solirubrobacterales bacterium]